MQLDVKVLGEPDVRFGGLPLRLPSGKRPFAKTMALLYYLAIEQRPVPRQELRERLWPGQNDANLRMALGQLRNCPGAAAWFDDGVSPSIQASTDLEAFERCMATGDYAQALALWKGSPDPQKHLLAGIENQKLPDDFLDLWLTPKRQDACSRYLEALYHRAQELELQGRAEDALNLAYTLVQHDPLHESGQLLVMRLEHQRGQHEAALTQYEKLRQALAKELEGRAAQPLPEIEALAKQIRRALEETQRARAANLKTLHDKLSSQATSFIGREQELEQALGLLSASDGRLLTLYGPGGVGKSRLALELAKRATPDFPDGVVLLELDGLEDPTLLPSSLAQALKIELRGQRDPKALVLEHVAERRLLLLLDNFEQLLEGADFIEALAAASPGSRLLVTSRVRLNLHRENLFEVTGLAYPSDPEAEDFLNYDAVRLFLQTARRAQPSFQLTDEDLAPLMRLCEFVGGMPLYLEHLAAWTRLMSLPAIAEELGKNLELFSSAHRDLPERHRKLEVVLESSWQLLSEDEKKILASLSVFRGGFTREAAKEVAGAGLASLRALVDKSFLYLRGLDRYSIHPPTRAFVERKLSANFAKKVLQSRAEYFLAFVRKAREGFSTSEQVAWLARLDQEIDNLRALLEWASQENEIELGLELTAKLTPFWEVRGLWREGLDYAEPFLARAKKQDAQYAAALQNAAILCRQAGTLDRAEALLQRARDVYSMLNDVNGMAATLTSLAIIAAQRGQLNQTIKYFQQCLAIEGRGDYQTSITLLNLGVAHSDIQDYPAARHYLAEALPLKRKVGDKLGLAIASSALGNIEMYEERYDEAEPLLEEALTIFREIGSKIDMAYVLISLGWLARERRNFKKARHQFKESLQLAKDGHDTRGESHALAHFGFLAYLEEDYEGALRYYRQALPLQLEIEEMSSVLETFAALAFIAGKQRDWARVMSLCGIISRLEAQSDSRLRARDQSQLKAWQDQARRELKDKAASRFSQRGKDMTIEQAVEYAFEG